jgi:antitoxin component of RelBE/YafQ-DinJ toxin-antitoxin module
MVLEVNVDNQTEKTFYDYAKTQNRNLSDVFVEALVEKIENEENMKAIKSYELNGHRNKVYPNAETLEAINDIENDRNMSRSFSGVDELMKDLNA